MTDNRHLYDYNYYHLSRNFQTKPERTLKLFESIMVYNPKSLLDVGCGLGSVVNKLRYEGIEAYGIDFAEVLKTIWNKPYFTVGDARTLPYPNDAFDIVFSSDFFEHIDEEDIDRVAKEMKRVGKKVITFVADDLGRELNDKQKEVHVTHKPLDWWNEKLEGVIVFSSHLNE